MEGTMDKILMGGRVIFGFGINKDKYYEELGVNKTCTKDELRKAYLKKKLRESS